MQYRIGEFSKMAKVSVKTLRYYDEVGLLKPERIDGWNKYRYYSTEQLSLMQSIISFRDAGLSIDEISQIMSGSDAISILVSKKEFLTCEKICTENKILLLDRMIKEFRSESNMRYEAIIREIPGYIVYYKQGKIDDFSKMTEFILDSAKECIAANPGIQCAESDYCYVTYTDEEFKQNNIGILYAQAVTEAGKETDTIKFRKLDTIEAVCVLHKGNYNDLGKAYAFALEWIKNNGMEPIEQIRECYIAGCWNKDDEKDYLTEIQIPIAKI